LGGRLGAGCQDTLSEKARKDLGKVLNALDELLKNFCAEDLADLH
jgi:hypothetical protein